MVDPRVGSGRNGFRLMGGHGRVTGRLLHGIRLPSTDQRPFDARVVALN